MKYALMIYHNPEDWKALSAEQQNHVHTEGSRKWEEIMASGEALMGEPFGDFRRYVTVRDGVTNITDGPYAEAKEQIVGFMLLDLASDERALELAASWPDSAVTGIEIRALGNFNSSTL